MRTTLSLLPDDRVASGADFVALGERVTKTPLWRHIVVDFEFDASAEIYSFRWVGDIDTGRSLAPNLTVTAMNNIHKHCRAYFNLIERLTNG